MMKKVFDYFRTCNIVTKISMAFILFVLLLAIFGTAFSKHSGYVPSGGSLVVPSLDHPLGTDELGIDVWAQICEGAKLSMMIGISSALISGVCGSFIGILCGYYGGVIDMIFMRICDVFIAIPSLPLMILMGVFLVQESRILLLYWHYYPGQDRHVLLARKLYH